MTIAAAGIQNEAKSPTCRLETCACVLYNDSSSMAKYSYFFSHASRFDIFLSYRFGIVVCFAKRSRRPMKLVRYGIAYVLERVS